MIGLSSFLLILCYPCRCPWCRLSLVSLCLPFLSLCLSNPDLTMDLSSIDVRMIIFFRLSSSPSRRRMSSHFPQSHLDPSVTSMTFELSVPNKWSLCTSSHAWSTRSAPWNPWYTNRWWHSLVSLWQKISLQDLVLRHQFFHVHEILRDLLGFLHRSVVDLRRLQQDPFRVRCHRLIPSHHYPHEFQPVPVLDAVTNRTSVVSSCISA